jgi:Protein of unknown function (DUF2877)
MAVSLVAVDYSRPIQPMFEQGSHTGTVHSVFHKAANIALDDSMLALLSDELPRMPNSVRLAAVVADELLWSLKPGMEVQVGSGRVFIPDLDFILHLPELPAWEPRPELMAYRWSREIVAYHVRLLARYLVDRSRQDGLALLAGPLLLGQQIRETPLLRMALPMLRMLSLATWQQDIAGVEAATHGLAGLGPGLTPSGDDALGGFAAVMALLSSRLSADAAPREHVATVIASAAQSRTTALSAILLAHAARGEVAEPLGTLLLTLALPTEASESLLQQADRVLEFGANSGSDTLLGILLGLRTLEGETD